MQLECYMLYDQSLGLLYKAHIFSIKITDIFFRKVDLE